MENLILYYLEQCPYSQKVLRFLQKNPTKITLKEIDKDSNTQNELLKIGGKIQVPCLNINGEALYESDEIIKWLATH